MKFEQHQMPTGAKPGDAWVCPKGTFKRVLSRGGAWENVNLGETHRDEVDHEQSAQPEAEQRDESSEVPVGTGESTSGNGDDGETVSEPSGERGPQDSVLSEPAGHETNDDVSETGEPLTSTGPIEGEGVDGNGSPVV